MFPFKHLPVLSEQDATQNFEQLSILLPSTQGTLDGRYLQQSEAAAKYLQTATAARKAAFGTVELEWTVKSATSGTKAITTGLASVVAFTGTAIVAAGIQVLNVVSVAGGTVNVASTGTGESAIGTKISAYWIAIGT